jgi:hypothetical protein
MRAPDLSWASFLLSVAKGKTNEIQDWRELQRRFHVSVTKDITAAHNIFCDGLELRDPFPLDHQWICAANKLVNQINHHLQQWRNQEARSFGIISAFTQLIKPLSNGLGLSETQQIDFIEKMNTLNLPSSDIPILERDPFVLIRNIDTRSALINVRRCRAIQIKTEQWFFSSRTVKPGHSREFPWRKLRTG